MKSGIGYSAGNGAKSETIFVKANASTSNTKNQPPPKYLRKRKTQRNHCFKCNRQGHSPPQCFIIEKKLICLASQKKKDLWYLDSGCSRHMTGKETYFI
ncbi:hypothetical protein PIB30_111512, partial [Stylosanthes scabra]|nr:hypothetical protein [Stylosanthes scabra]